MKMHWSGWVLIGLGLLILLIASFFGIGSFLVSLIYGLPLLIIGIIVFFNSKEDKIEEINYKGVKKNVRK
jgi:uncharacterized membrane protein